MAFRQPTRQPLQRVIRPARDDRDAPVVRTRLQDEPAASESQTWVVFAPATETTTSTSYLSDAEESVPTPGRSRFSDLGSLNIAGRLNEASDSRRSDILSSAIDDESLEDDAELDSLDSHLADFRPYPGAHSRPATGNHHDAPVVPMHDGLGSFRLDAPVNTEVQERLYAFERYNPGRTRRRESIEHAEHLAQEEEQLAHKMQRIEAWRLEHSRILLEEIQKETRKRRQSLASSKGPHLAHKSNSEASVSTAALLGDGDNESMDWHDQVGEDIAEDRGLFAKLTRKVLRDIIGIDERLLSVLLGEALPDDDDLSSTPKALSSKIPATVSNAGSESSWQLRLLEQVASELGILVNHLSPHPGAFSAYTHMKEMPIPYAGLAAIPEVAGDSVTNAGIEHSATMPEFKPTMPTQVHPIDIPVAQSHVNTSQPHRPPREDIRGEAPALFTQEEWEQDLDIKLVFKYLRNRFTTRSTSASPFTSGTSHLATCSTQESAAKAARVRQHHPLVGRNRPVAERRAFKAVAPTSPVVVRHASSCASHSTRRSARRSSLSSKHYWDIGDSLGTGSVIASAGPMGSWGEV